MKTLILNILYTSRKAGVVASLALLIAILGVGSEPAFAASSGKTIAVWRPSDGTWHVLNLATQQTVIKQWGQQGDIPVSGDYDGDGTADFAVWRPSTGMWLIINSSNGTVTSQQWGQQGDIPVPFDYDGDGKTDIAVFRPSTGMWLVINSSNGMVTSQQWGVSTDVPVPGNYKLGPCGPLFCTTVPAFAVWRPSSGTWFTRNVGDAAQSQRQWGQAGDIPVPDYYQGGWPFVPVDFAIWRPSTGMWAIINNSDGTSTSQQWGQQGDIPVPDDYDQDGKVDIAVWRPPTGMWYIVNSSDHSMTSQQLGQQGDIPVKYWVKPPLRQ
jgi:hypothetical protein